MDGGAIRRAGAKHRILIATDAWLPQVNGVARTLEWLRDELVAMGVDVVMLTPEGFASVPAPSYPNVRLALATPGAIGDIIEKAAPDAVHIATEGPIGFLTRLHCLRSGRRFTTCYHTRFPEYLAARWPIPLSWSYAALRRFHNAAAVTMVSSASIKRDLKARGFERLAEWRRGIPLRLFKSTEKRELIWPKPSFLYVGRVAVEKNIAAFLELDLPGAKIVVGEGPARPALMQAFPHAIFTGRLDGAELEAAYGSADVLVFPSRTDTFGLVMLEAIACGVPVAAYPVTGPLDVLGDSGCGILSEDLREAALQALDIPRAKCRRYGAAHGMRESAFSFVDNIVMANDLDWTVSPRINVAG